MAEATDKGSGPGETDFETQLDRLTAIVGELAAELRARNDVTSAALAGYASMALAPSLEALRLTTERLAEQVREDDGPTGA